MARDTPNAERLSAGKFLPDATGAANLRGDTRQGEFAGVPGYLRGAFQGDDRIVSPLRSPVPGGLTLPLNLREKTASRASRWTHLLTIEPPSDRGEPPTTPRPFTVRPHRDSLAAGRARRARSGSTPTVCQGARSCVLR